MKSLTEKGSLLYNRFLQATSRRWYVLIPLFVALPLVLKFLVFENASIIGNDTQTHIYKAIILQRNMEQMPFYLWGKWDWNWYAGYPFLQVYSPLFYYIMAIISSIFNISVDLAARLVLPFFFFLSALSMYLLCIHLTKNKLASMLGAATYAYSPYLIANLSVFGSVGSFIAFAFLPLALLFADRLCDNGKRARTLNIDAFLSAVFTGLTLLSNQAFGLLLLIVVLLYLILQRKVLAGIKVVIETFLITAFWLLPYAANIGQNTFAQVTSSNNPLTMFIDILTLYFGYVTIVLLIMAVWLARKRLIKNIKICTVGAIIGLFTVYNIIIYFFPLPFFSAFALGRTAAVFVMLVPLFVALALAFGSKISKKGVIVSIFLVLLVIQGLSVWVYVPLTVGRYTDAYPFLTTDDSWFRALQLPREPVGSLIPIVSNKPVIDGWFDQASSLSGLIANLSMSQWFLGAPTNQTSISEPQKAIAALGYLGVKYIIVDEDDPVFGPEFSQALYRAVDSTENATPVYITGDITVFRLDTFQNLTLATSVVPVNNLTEFMDDLPHRQENEAIVYSGQKSLLPTGSGGTPNYKILSINQTIQSMDYKFYVDRPALLILPLDYDKSLQVSVNGTQVPFYKVPPGIIGIPLGNAGTYVIEVEPAVTSLQLIASSISIIWIIAFLIITFEGTVKKRWWSKRENTM
jgi:hypothetical protein